jgi:S1-C subfamily serine protease
LPIKIGNNKNIEIGDKVYAIGHPGGYPWTFSEGIINQIRKNFNWSYSENDNHQATLIQVQTPINPGNSGGPLFSEGGNLIGVNTLKASGENLNFAVAVDHAINFLKKNSYIKTTNPAEIIMKKDYPKAKLRTIIKMASLIHGI